jgi:hypothetical protein
MGCWPKKVFYDIGLFDEELVRDQDDEFNYRLRKMGGKILLNQEIHSDISFGVNQTCFGSNTFNTDFGSQSFTEAPKQMSLRQFVHRLLFFP